MEHDFTETHNARIGAWEYILKRAKAKYSTIVEIPPVNVQNRGGFKDIPTHFPAGSTGHVIGHTTDMSRYVLAIDQGWEPQGQDPDMYHVTYCLLTKEQFFELIKDKPPPNTIVLRVAAFTITAIGGILAGYAVQSYRTAQKAATAPVAPLIPPPASRATKKESPLVQDPSRQKVIIDWEKIDQLPPLDNMPDAPREAAAYLRNLALSLQEAIRTWYAQLKLNYGLARNSAGWAKRIADENCNRFIELIDKGNGWLLCLQEALSRLEKREHKFQLWTDTDPDTAPSDVSIDAGQFPQTGPEYKKKAGGYPDGKFKR